jgi:dTDP-4-dehydrorhamnose 3,5-epimerase
VSATAIESGLPGVVLIEPRVHGDARGYLLVSWQVDGYAELGVRGPFVQDNVSYSRRGVLRGLHLQHPGGQAKLVSVLRGAVYDVAVDVRRGSPSFGRWMGAILSDENHRQVYIPAGFAHGFLVLSDDALVSYKVDALYRPDAEFSLRWDDPVIGIEWPLSVAPQLSDKDALAPGLQAVSPDRLPQYTEGVPTPGAPAPLAAAEPIGGV